MVDSLFIVLNRVGSNESSTEYYGRYCIVIHTVWWAYVKRWSPWHIVRLVNYVVEYFFQIAYFYLQTLPLLLRIFCSLIFLNLARNLAESSNFLHASHASIDPLMCSSDWKSDFFWFFSSISANSFSNNSSSSSLNASSRSWNAVNWSCSVTLK